MILSDLVGLILNTLFPTIVVAVLAVVTSFFTLWVGFRYQSKPIKNYGFALLMLGVSYFFSYFEVGDRTLRHSLIRFSIVWVIVAIGMGQIWRLAQNEPK